MHHFDYSLPSPINYASRESSPIRTQLNADSNPSSTAIPLATAETDTTFESFP